MTNCIRKLREERGWSQADLAAKLGVSRQGAHALETGKSVPSLLLALRVSWLFGTPIEEIFTVELEEKMTLTQAKWEYSDRLATALDEVGLLERMGHEGWEMIGIGPLVINFRRPEENAFRCAWEHRRLNGALASRTRQSLEDEGWLYCGTWMGVFHYFKRPAEESKRLAALGARRV